MNEATFENLCAREVKGYKCTKLTLFYLSKLKFEDISRYSMNYY